jgi:hypothetical protein
LFNIRENEIASSTSMNRGLLAKTVMVSYAKELLKEFRRVVAKEQRFALDRRAGCEVN